MSSGAVTQSAGRGGAGGGPTTFPEGARQVLVALDASGEAAVSGESLSSQLGVSRNQIWKHVDQLRKRGYAIEGEPGGGYRLTGRPDRLFPHEIAAGLETNWLGRSVEHFEETDSTNRVAFERGRAGAPAGTAILAEAQNAGRGRLGRSFFSPPHQNLYTSILLRPKGSIAEAPTLILAAAIAVAETIEEWVQEAGAVEIKWPNDVLIRGRKTSGILMESSAEGSHLAFAVLGIGINLNVSPAAFPEEFRALATSLSEETGEPVDRLRLTQRLFAHLETRIDQHAQGGFEVQRSDFEARFRMLGEVVGVEATGGQTLEGWVRGIAPDGGLEIEVKEGPRAGESVRVLAGDVTLAKRPRERHPGRGR